MWDMWFVKAINKLFMRGRQVGILVNSLLFYSISLCLNASLAVVQLHTTTAPCFLLESSAVLIYLLNSLLLAGLSSHNDNAE